MVALAGTAYLETDTKIDVAFYETLGFLVITHELVSGVPDWFMSRPPLKAQPLHHMRPPTSETPRN